MVKKIILTPKPCPAPKINGAKVFGVRPGRPFLFQVPATGAKPLKYSAEKLPGKLSIDSTSGLITGVVDEPGTFEAIISVKNSEGTAQRGLRIEVGDKICLTPPWAGILGMSTPFGCRKKKLRGSPRQ